MTRLAVFDSNVIVSADINRNGAPAQLVLNWVLEGQLQLVTCPAIVGEFRDVLYRTKFRRHSFPPIWLDILVQDSLALPDPPPWKHPLPDPDDAVFLALAASAGATLVTGNLIHYPQLKRERVTVLSPAEYLLSLQSRP